MAGEDRRCKVGRRVMSWRTTLGRRHHEVISEYLTLHLERGEGHMCCTSLGARGSRMVSRALVRQYRIRDVEVLCEGRARRGGPRVSDPVLSRCMKSMMYSYRVPSRNAKRVAVVHIRIVGSEGASVSESAAPGPIQCRAPGKTPPPPTPKLTSEVNRPRRPDLRGQPPDRRLRARRVTLE